MNGLKSTILQKLCNDIGATTFTDKAQLSLRLDQQNLEDLFGDEIPGIVALFWDDYILPDCQFERITQLNEAKLNQGEFKGSYNLYFEKIGVVNVTEYRNFFVDDTGENCMEGYIVKNDINEQNDDSIIQLFISVQKALNQTAIVSITDKQGIIIYANNLFVECSGYELDELIGKSHSLINSGFHPKSFFVDLWKTIGSGNVWRGEVCNRSKKGELYWVDTAISPIFNSEGEIERYLSVRFQITDRKRAENLLRKSDEFSKSIFSTMSSHIAVIDSKGTILFVNESWEKANYNKFSGISSRPSVGENYLKTLEKEALRNESCLQAIRLLNQLFENNNPHLEIEYQSDYLNETRWYIFSASQIKDNSKRILIRHVDITDRKKLFREVELKEEELKRKIDELQRVNEELVQFNYIISHNLRSPLSNVVGLSNLFSTRAYEPDKAKELARYIKESALQIDEVVKDLSSILSLTVAGKPKTEVVNLKELILTIAKDLNILDNVELNLSKECYDFVSIKCYVESILFNILSNSVKYKSKLRTLKISVSVFREEEIWVFEIEDNGLGLDVSKYKHELFGMYKRFHPTAAEGKGIGLYITKKQVDLLKGQIVYEGNPDQGTKVILRLNQTI